MGNRKPPLLYKWWEYVTNVELATTSYGGKSGKKLGIKLNGEYYLLKFPKELSLLNLKNSSLSYSNSSTSEYLGSHIYEIMGIPVHETLLGYRGEKLMVACKDFREAGTLQLQHFSEFQVTTEKEFTNSKGSSTSSSTSDTTDLVASYNTIREHEVLQQFPESMDRFWDMFVVDAFIGNPDRNNNNWGLLSKNNNIVGLAPVFDNDNSLNDKWDDSKMKLYLQDEVRIKEAAYKGIVNVFRYKDKKVNPFKVMQSNKFPECAEAILRIVPKIDMNKISLLFEDALDSKVISETQRKFYTKLLETRFDDMLVPLYQKIAEQKREQEEQDLDYIDDYCR